VVSALIALGMTVVGALALELVYPAFRGESGRPPLGVLFNGLVEGSLVALTAVALILVYRSSRIINFAQVALGSAAGLMVTQLSSGYHLNVLAALPLALLAAVFAGVLAELALRRFARAPRLLVTVATITLAPAATLVMGRVVAALDPLPPGARQAGASLRTVAIPFSGFTFRIDPLPFSFAHLFTLGSMVVALLGVGLFLKITRYGRAVRAAADNPEGAALLGINTRMLSLVVWALAALLSGLASVASLTLHGIDIAGRDGGASALLPALAAAMIAGFESIPLAAFVALWIQVIEQGTQWAYPNAGFVEPGLLLLIVGAVLLRRGSLQRRQLTESGLWDTVRELRPAPAALRALPGIRRSRATVLLAVAALAIVFPFVASAGQVHGGTATLIYVMVAISLLMVTSWLGQINLGQFALVAIGAVVAGGLTSRFGLSFWLAMPVASLVVGAVAVLLGLAALRVHGLWLAPVTLVLAAAMPVILFTGPYFGWLRPEGSIDRPGLPFVDLNDGRSFYFFLLACTAATIYAAVRFRRSRLGAMVIALRDNEAAALATGIEAVRSRVVALGLAGMITGFAGALLAVSEQSVDAGGFGAELSLNIFVMVVLGGLGGVSGAVLGAVFGGALLFIPPFDTTLAPLITGVGALLILLVLPEGLSGGLFAVRDSIFRLIAIRRHLDVPSLTGTSDLEGGVRRWRLAPPDRKAGLAALPAAQRYAKPSILSRRSGP